MNKIHGKTDGIKEVLLNELKTVYNLTVPKYQLVSSELLEIICRITAKVNKEIAVFIDRRGVVVSISIGDHNTVNLFSYSNRRSESSLTGLRCIHTHPNGSGKLSTLDLSALISLRLDAMVAVGIIDSNPTELFFAIPGSDNQTTIAKSYGPIDPREVERLDFSALILEIEHELQKVNQLDRKENETEKAVLVACVSGKISEQETLDSLKELEALSETAGLKTLHYTFQKRDKPDQATYLGKGKIIELSHLIQTLDANVLVCDDEITPNQQRNLEKILGIKVIDRTVLILDIFAQRARTKEGKIQVELAQLNYLLPRLIGSGMGLSRLGGGIGTRGPGETKLEVDRRKIRKKVNDLERELGRICNQRNLLRKRRKETQVPIVALVGYTNAGKSSLINKILQSSDANSNLTSTDKAVFSADMLFATLDPTYRRIVSEDGTELIFVDTVGFINKLPHHLIKAFRATLEEVLEADLLIHVVDGSSDSVDIHRNVVLQVLKDLGAKDKPIITAINKIDLIEGSNNLPLGDGIEIPISATTGKGLDLLLKTIIDILPAKRISSRFLFKHNEGKQLNYLHSIGQVTSVHYFPEGTIVNANLLTEDYNRLKQYVIEEEI